MDSRDARRLRTSNGECRTCFTKTHRVCFCGLIWIPLNDNHLVSRGLCLQCHETSNHNEREPLVPPASSSATTTCCICYGTKQYCQMATINSCRHRFCFSCIQRWSKEQNKCPLCKVRFNYIRSPEGTLFHTWHHQGNANHNHAAIHPRHQLRTINLPSDNATTQRNVGIGRSYSDEWDGFVARQRLNTATGPRMEQFRPAPLDFQSNMPYEIRRDARLGVRRNSLNLEDQDGSDSSIGTFSFSTASIDDESDDEEEEEEATESSNESDEQEEESQAGSSISNQVDFHHTASVPPLPTAAARPTRQEVFDWSRVIIDMPACPPQDTHIRRLLHGGNSVTPPRRRASVGRQARCPLPVSPQVPRQQSGGHEREYDSSHLTRTHRTGFSL